MPTKYDTNEWESETSLGRRVFIYNFGMRGDEFTGWELIKTVVIDHEPGVREKIYMWMRKSAEEELVQVSVVETDYWRHAQQYLKMQLQHCMAPEVPRATDKAAPIGDIQYAARKPDSKNVVTMFFVRANLQISVRSVGTKPVDVTKFAAELDAAITHQPTKDEAEAENIRTLKPGAVTVKKDEKTVLLDQLPEPVTRSGWLRVAVPDGELRREGDALEYISDKPGRKSVRIVNLSLE